MEFQLHIDLSLDHAESRATLFCFVLIPRTVPTRINARWESFFYLRRFCSLVGGMSFAYMVSEAEYLFVNISPSPLRERAGSSSRDLSFRLLWAYLKSSREICVLWFRDPRGTDRKKACEHFIKLNVENIAVTHSQSSLKFKQSLFSSKNFNCHFLTPKFYYIICVKFGVLWNEGILLCGLWVFHHRKIIFCGIYLQMIKFRTAESFCPSHATKHVRRISPRKDLCFVRCKRENSSPLFFRPAGREFIYKAQVECHACALIL